MTTFKTVLALAGAAFTVTVMDYLWPWVPAIGLACGAGCVIGVWSVRRR